MRDRVVIRPCSELLMTSTAEEVRREAERYRHIKYIEGLWMGIFPGCLMREASCSPGGLRNNASCAESRKQECKPSMARD